MEKKSLISRICYLCFAIHTICIVELIDVLMLKKPYVTIFVAVFGCCYYLNYKFYKILRNYRKCEAESQDINI